MKHRLFHLALNIAVLLASSSTLFAAEKPAPPKPDSILADMKTTAKAEWRAQWPGGEAGPPTLDIIVQFRGTAVEKASEFGELRLGSVLDEHGKSYRWPCRPFPFNCQQMRSISSLNSDSDDSFHLLLQIPNRPPIQTIRELRGSLSLKTDGTFEDCLLDGVFKNLVDPTDENADPDEWGTVVRDKRLDSLGVKLSVARRPIPKSSDFEGVLDYIRVNIKSDSLPVIACEILDAKGKPIEVHGTASWNKPVSLDMWSSIRIPTDARLKLTFHKNARKVQVPFVVKDIAVPKFDKKDKSLDIPASADNAFVEAETLSPTDPIAAGLQ
jgi:hypothetical protein